MLLTRFGVTLAKNTKKKRTPAKLAFGKSRRANSIRRVLLQRLKPIYWGIVKENLANLRKNYDIRPTTKEIELLENVFVPVAISSTMLFGGIEIKLYRKKFTINSGDPRSTKAFFDSIKTKQQFRELIQLLEQVKREELS